MNYNNQMQINGPKYHILPDSFDARIQNKILAQDRTINDKCYLKTYVRTNKEESQYKVTNHRAHFDQCKLPFKTSHPLYENIGIDDGHVGQCTVNQDSELTRGMNFWSKPLDKLNDKVTSERHMIYLPPTKKVIKQDSFQDRFLISTSQSHNPQANFDPSFEIYGVYTRDYKRKNDKYYRKCRKFDQCNKISHTGRRYK